MADVAYSARAGTVEAETGGDVADYIALMKPRVMFLVVFTALVGLVAAPGSMHPVLAIAALICIAAGAGASGALNMWYDADIDAADGAHRRAPGPARIGEPGGSALVRHGAGAGLGALPGADGQLGRRRAARAHHRLLRSRLYDVAQALDAAEHRHWRRRRRRAADDRLGRGHGRQSAWNPSCCS